MRGGAVTILLGLTALISYFIGRQDAPPAAPSASAITHPGYSKPVALVDAPLHVRAIQPQPTPTPSSTPSAKASQPSASAPQSDTKRKVEVVLTAAAIATIIIKASRDRYYATGHPCACPMISCATAEHAAAGAPIHGREEQRRSAIRPT